MTVDPLLEPPDLEGDAAHRDVGSLMDDGHGQRPAPMVFVLIGVTSDLARRSTIPAIAELVNGGRMPDSFVLIGLALEEMTDAQFQQQCLQASGSRPTRRWAQLVQGFRYVAGDVEDDETFARLRQAIEASDSDFGTSGNRLYYLATYPRLLNSVVLGLRRHGLNRAATPQGFARIVLEKPFGTDLLNARALEKGLREDFAGRDIYRMDQFLGSDAVLNLLAFRFSNSIFEPTWNNRYIDHIQLISADNQSVGHRGFYDTAGQLRDVFQNHIMQYMAFTMMDSPERLDGASIADEKIRFLRALRVAEPLSDTVIRGQYGKGVVNGFEVPGYREEPAIDPDSETETYLAARLTVDNERWSGVPIYVRTGKRLAQRATQISVVFKEVDRAPFAHSGAASIGGGQQVLRIRPQNGIGLSFYAKVPGRPYRLRQVSMDFSYLGAFPGPRTNASVQLLRDAMLGDPSLFIRPDEVDRAWSIVKPMQDAFTRGEVPLLSYAAGSWGPSAAARLLSVDGRVWDDPDVIGA